jgi:hypothetical protein
MASSTISRVGIAGLRSATGGKSRMSLGVYPVFESKLKGTKFGSLGELLAANLEKLDKIARSARLTPLAAFADNRPIPDDFDGDPDELAEVMGEWTEWFDATEGQAAIRALADHVRASAKAAKSLDAADGVVEELGEMARVLGVAAKQGVRFRLHLC